MDWQPIETAPKNGDPILACIAGATFFPEKVQWLPGLGWSYGCLKHGPAIPLTHWMPLPEPPHVTTPSPTAE